MLDKILDTDYSAWAGSALKVLLVLVTGYIIAKLSSVIFKKGFSAFVAKRQNPEMQRRTETVISLIGSCIEALILFFVVLEVLSILGLGDTVTSMIAAAGVGGLAIGFAAQSLIKDFITGLFLITEQQFAVGDYVCIGGVEGTVESIKIRTTQILTITGELHIIPNGNIDKVVNYSIKDSLAVVYITVPLEADLYKVIDILRNAAQRAVKDDNNGAEEPYINGVSDTNESGAVIRIICTAKPEMQYSLERLIRLYALEDLKKAGIQPAYPKRINIVKKDGEG